jgi:hypothetical protein
VLLDLLTLDGIGADTVRHKPRGEPMLQVLAVSALLATTADAAVAPPTLRLPSDVRPVRQKVELSLDPGSETYTGAIDVVLEVTRETPLLWLNATDLKVTNARLGPEG